MRKISYREAEVLFDSSLDEIYGEVLIGPCSFNASEVLRELDPIAYDHELTCWADAEGLELVDD